MGFLGRIEYRHVYSQTGGAQYGLAREPKDDLLSVFAEAFERDADPADFSLEVLIAHERGHQLIARHEPLRRNLPAAWSASSEEVVASVVGSVLVDSATDREALAAKATFEAVQLGMEFERAAVFVIELRAILEELL